LRTVSGKEMCRILEHHGWELIRVRGSHHAYEKAGYLNIVVVPVHSNKDLKTGTQRSIMKDAGLTEDDL
jgi:predicted RNA binding protein YcfA (HicA-like mRNA interferase family)